MIPTINLAQSFSGSASQALGVYTAWDPATKTTNVTLSNQDRTASADTANFESWRAVRNDFNTATGGKYYWEAVVDACDGTSSDLYIGLRRTSDSESSEVQFLGSGRHAVRRGNGTRFTTGWTSNGTSVTFAALDVLQFALDIDNGKFFLGKNGTWDNSSDPAAGTNANFTDMPASESYVPFCSTDNFSGIVTVTLRSRPGDLSFAAPSGFTAGIPA